jgi:hypothetical protein
MATPPSSATANFSTFNQPFSNVRRVARPENGHPPPRTRTLLSYAEATGRFHVRLVVTHAT